MSYSVALAADAEAKLARLPAVVATRLVDELLRLEQGDPYDLLIPWFFLYRPADWYCRCAFDADGRAWVFHAGVEMDTARQVVNVLYLAQTSPPP